MKPHLILNKQKIESFRGKLSLCANGHLQLGLFQKIEFGEGFPKNYIPFQYAICVHV